MIVVYEVSLSIARLVRKYGRNISLIEWDHVIGILMIIFEHIEVSSVHQMEISSFKSGLHSSRSKVRNLPPITCWRVSVMQFLQLRVTMGPPSLTVHQTCSSHWSRSVYLIDR